MADIKPFPTETEQEKRLHKVGIIDGRPIPSIEYVNKDYVVPKELIKYYKADEYGCKVVTDNKIWASHPFSFNDPFDCPIQIWNKNDFPKDFAIGHLEELKQELRKLGVILKETDSDTSVESVRRRYFDIYLKFMSIFCLNDYKNSELFWGYYNNHEGFSIVFDSDALSRHWRMKPLKVEYDNEENFQKISLIEDEVKNFVILPKIVRWATLKKSEWSHENEWRFIFLDNDFLERNRLKDYPENSLVEVVLGYKFFIDQVKDFRDNRQTDNIRTYKFLLQDNQAKLYLLSEIYKKGIELYQVELSENLEIIKRQIEILEIKNNKVTIFHSDITKK